MALGFSEWFIGWLNMFLVADVTCTSTLFPVFYAAPGQSGWIGYGYGGLRDECVGLLGRLVMIVLVVGWLWMGATWVIR